MSCTTWFEDFFAGGEMVSINDELTQNVEEEPSLRGNSSSNLSNLGEIVGGQDWIYVSFKDHITNASAKDGSIE